MGATRAIIRLDHLGHNIEEIRRAAKAARRAPMLCLAVKADAYGHGMIRVALAAAELGVDCLAVARVDEGIELRRAGVSLPILLYSLATPDECAEVVEHSLSPLVADEEQVRLFDALARRRERTLRVHLKIDTGMGRIGCRPDEAPDLARAVVECRSLELGGVATHFAVADGRDPEYTKRQLAAFESALSAIRAAGIEPGIVHAANSGGLLGHPDSWYDMVRPGILAYGYYPSDEQERRLDVRPVMELRSRVVFIKEVEAGAGVSYGVTWRAPRRTHIGTIPVGYGDGYNRLLSNRADVAINGVRYPVVGRVCMDQIMVDLGPECSVSRFDEATLFGYTPGAPTAEELANLCGTIAYEITCNVGTRVPRVYRDGGQ